MKAEIRLQRVNKTYRPGETLAGTLEIETDNHPVPHEGITIHLDGHIVILRSKMSLSDKEVISLADVTIQIVKPGKLPATKDKLNIPFSLVLERTVSELFDTYHGVNINVEYILHGEVKRGLLAQKMMTAPLEIYVESRPAAPNIFKRKALEFVMTPQSVNPRPPSYQLVVSPGPNTIDFEIRGHLTSTTYSMEEPLTGQINVLKTSRDIKSIEIQLLRLEELAASSAKQTSEVQNIQVAEGHIREGLDVPLFMVFPRYYSCPSQSTTDFGINFQVNIAVIFESNHVVSEAIPIKLYR